MLIIMFVILLAAFITVQFMVKDNATVPIRVFGKRTVWAASFFAFNLGAALLIAIYFLPLWFQAVKGASAMSSGVMSLPLLLGNVVFSIIAGSIVTALGYYTPCMIVGSILMVIGFVFISTLNPETPSFSWVGYQIIAGGGVGLGIHQPLVAVQTVLDISDIPTGTSIVLFFQTIGGAIFLSVGQAVFTNKLVDGMRKQIPTLDPATIFEAGATGIQAIIPQSELEMATLSYSNALNCAFLVSVVSASFAVIGSLIIEWKSVRPTRPM
jgi:hypothetical protein